MATLSTATNFTTISIIRWQLDIEVSQQGRAHTQLQVIYSEINADITLKLLTNHVNVSWMFVENLFFKNFHSICG